MVKKDRPVFLETLVIAAKALDVPIESLIEFTQVAPTAVIATTADEVIDIFRSALSQFLTDEELSRLVKFLKDKVKGGDDES